MTSLMTILKFGLLYMLSNAINVNSNSHEKALGSSFSFSKSLQEDVLPMSELNALQDLFTECGGEKWRWGLPGAKLPGIPWNFTGSPNPCADGWQGVSCTYLVSDGFEHVTKLLLKTMNLKGNLPETIAQLIMLQQLDLSVNSIVGTIPDAIGAFSYLVDLYLNSNLFSGSIPIAVGNISNLEVISLQANNLIGTIPNTLCNCSALVALRAHVNALTGTLPACLMMIPTFSVLVLYVNMLSGPLPDTYANHSSLDYFDINSNYFTGPLPEALSEITNLGSIYMGENWLTGTVPASYGSLSNLQALYITFNYLTGTLPAEYSNLVSVLFIETSGNLLTGTLPVSWSTLPAIQEIHVDTSYLVGSIPPEYCNLPVLQLLSIYKNLLSGSIPQNIAALTSLQYIEFDYNLFTGSIPLSVGTIPLLQSLEINNNFITGSLPVSLNKLPKLTNLLVQSNRMTGSLNGTFDPTVHTLLSTVQVSNNDFTGTLPSALFQMPNLLTLAAVSNCFEGSLPASICDSQTIQVLVLSGLRTSHNCQTRLLPGVSKAYIIEAPIAGGIPQCLFAKPTLTTLQLSGNGLTGTLPSDLEISPSLSDLSLSHNSLSGTIPSNFQTRTWSNFDVSYNRFTGSLSEDMETKKSPYFNFSYENSALSLQNNRLSGEIPSSIKPLANITILRGNLFSCSAVQNDIPVGDPGAYNYECGSTTFIVPYSCWMCLTFLVLCVVAWGVYRAMDSPNLPVKNEGFSTINTLKKWYLMLRFYEGVDSSVFPMVNLRYVISLYNSVNKIAGNSAIYAVVVLLPLYAILSAYSGTMEEQYAYTVSAAFMSGERTGGLVMTFLVLLQCLVIALCIIFWKKPDARVVQHAHRSVTNSTSGGMKSSLLGRAVVYCTLLTVNMIAVFGANIAYVYVALYEGSDLLLTAQILLSAFKLSWNKFSGSSLIPLTAQYLSPSVTTDLQASTIEFFPLQLFLSLVNNIAIPCVVVMIISPNCFNYVFTKSPTVTSDYIVKQCLVLNNVALSCDEFIDQMESTSFDPPFTYSFQCSASFVTYYAPAFVIMSIMSTFGLPLLQSVLVFLYTTETRWFEESGVASWRYHILDGILPNLLKPPVPPSSHVADLRESQYVDSSRRTILQRDIFTPHFPANQVLLNMLTYLGILLTFGAVFPPLAAALAVAVIGTAVYARLKVGRFFTAAVELKQFKYFELFDQECRGIGTLDMLLRSMFMLLTFSCLFYTLFLFDTLGDQVGLYGAYWVLIVMPLVPVCLYCTMWAYVRRSQAGSRLNSEASSVSKSPSIDPEGCVELQGAVIVDSQHPRNSQIPQISDNNNNENNENSSNNNSNNNKTSGSSSDGVSSRDVYSCDASTISVLHPSDNM